MISPILVLITTSSEDEVYRLGKTLVEEQLAACANIVSGIRSLYTWKGEFCDETECLLMLKTRKQLLDPLIVRVKELHSYEVPEIMAVPMDGGSEDYIKWMEEVLL
jgi:periplasmic divalent cation tolerance protein